MPLGSNSLLGSCPHIIQLEAELLIVIFASQISVIIILLETKGISLERMDKLFGGVDAVQAGEDELSAEKLESIIYRAGEKSKEIEKSALPGPVAVTEHAE
jgi:hypothetical protein